VQGVVAATACDDAHKLTPIRLNEAATASPLSLSRLTLIWALHSIQQTALARRRRTIDLTITAPQGVASPHAGDCQGAPVSAQFAPGRQTATIGHTRGIRLDAREHSATVAATLRALDDTDRAILDWEDGFPTTGPHLDRVGIGLEEYKRRVYALLANPTAECWSPESVFRLRARYGGIATDQRLTD
jgi:hypothetical protein